MKLSCHYHINNNNNNNNHNGCCVEASYYSSMPNKGAISFLRSAIMIDKNLASQNQRIGVSKHMKQFLFEKNNILSQAPECHFNVDF